MTLEGRTAVITGGGRGIGEAVAKALARAGASVVVASRTVEQVEAVAADLRREGRTAHAVACDVTDPASVDALARAAEQALGRVDILVNNAGAAGSAPVHRLGIEEWDRLFAVNARGTFLCTRAFIGGMMERRWGRVVNVASVAGLHGARYIAAYAASKHAVIGFTRAAAADVAAYGVTVNAVCPGYADTEMTRQSVARIVEKTGMSEAQALDAILSQNPQRRLITPEEVAHVVLALCDERARGINGQAIVIDGGALLA
ncbi:MAG TPA: SDR family NAD(P)-dependent oxidoreductase [Longimicrobiales bacterium]|nr:SDR family NAD(P)-dependent oxidoreductase [Longimicrobiales bacterium]